MNDVRAVYDAKDKVQEIFQGRDDTGRMSRRNMECHLTTRKRFPDTGSILMEYTSLDLSQRRNRNDIS